MGTSNFAPGGGLAKDAVYCQEQLAAYWELMLVQSLLKDIWSPLEIFVRSQARDEPENGRSE